MGSEGEWGIGDAGRRKEECMILRKTLEAMEFGDGEVDEMGIGSPRWVAFL